MRRNWTMGFGSLLRNLRHRAGFSSIEAFATAMGFRGASSVQRYESDSDYGDKPLPLRFVTRAAKVLVGRGNPTIERREVLLLADSGADLIEMEELISSNTGDAGHRPPTDSSLTINIPELDVTAAAGGGAIVVDETKIFNWKLPIDALPTASSKGLYIISIRGDSMLPTLASTDRVVIDTAENEGTWPGIYAVNDGSGLVVKRLQSIPKTEPRRFSIMSDNPAYKTYELSVEEMVIVGRVVAAWRRL